MMLRSLAALSWLLVSCSARTSLGEPEPEASGVCGNGVLDAGEACDDGNDEENDRCRSNCVQPKCGDAIVDLGEACDDGNTDETDACTSFCRLTTCGNGALDSGEACDDPNPDLCTPSCTLPVCGDGFLAPATESCDAGAANENRPALAIVTNGFEVPTTTFASPLSDLAFYSYESASAHTGFEEARASKLFAYQSPFASGLSIFTIHNIDLDSSGIATGRGSVQQFFEGLPSGAFVAFADDDPDELSQSGAFIEGDWRFNDNTDGGILGNLAFPGDWRVEVSSTFGEGISRWSWLDPSLTQELSEGVAELVARSEPAACRLDCRIPTCGDGFVDAGEVCDDGNRGGGDGCSTDCSSVEFANAR